MLKNPSATQEPQETRVRSLSREDPLEERAATDSMFLPGESPWTEEPGGLQSLGSQSQTRLKRLGTHSTAHLGVRSASCSAVSDSL